MGCPTMDALPTNKDVFWSGMEELADCPNTWMKLSMLCYTNPEWDQSKTVVDAVHRVIKLFGTDRCFFCSNFPVDPQEGWHSKRLFKAFWKLTERYTLEERKAMFSDNAKRAYRVLA